jgi:hypothetical protein
MWEFSSRGRVVFLVRLWTMDTDRLNGKIVVFMGNGVRSVDGAGAWLVC